MRIALFYHSLVSDWNHGNAHFLRGVATELLARGHEVRIFEPRDSWSARNLAQEHGLDPVRRFHRRYPGLRARRYDLATVDLERVLDGTDLAVVHEWNAPELVQRIGRHRSRSPGLRLFFHDTHHRMVSAPESMARYDLRHYDGVLAYGRVLRDLYATSGLVARAWTWHEAADVRVFHPPAAAPSPGEPPGDLVWIGNWGDDERTAELYEFLVGPCEALRLRARVHGVRYPAEAQSALAQAGLDYRGWLANFDVPAVFAQHRVTVHVPRRPYVRILPGIPTIRPFEALACGIPLVSAPWDDAEGLFRAGRDYLVAPDGHAMRRQLRAVLNEPGLARELSAHGLQTIRERHTCRHRVDELLAINRSLRSRVADTCPEPPSTNPNLVLPASCP